MGVTQSIGNTGAGQAHNFNSENASPTLFGVRWDGDKVRGVRLEMDDGTSGRKYLLSLSLFTSHLLGTCPDATNPHLAYLELD
jgi:hypothetical protein